MILYSQKLELFEQKHKCEKLRLTARFFAIFMRKK